MKRPFLTQTHWSGQMKGNFWVILTMLLMSFNQSIAQACATLINVPSFVCSGSQTTHLLNNYNAANTYTFSFITGSAVVNTSALPFVTISWNTTGNVVMIMTETPPVGTCTPDTFNIFVSNSFAPSPSCNDTVNLSLDEFCTGIVTPDMVMEGIYNYLEYEIIVIDPRTGNVIPTSPLVDKTYVGRYLQVRARHRCSGNYCWGVLLVEDKLPPNILCRTYTVNCDAPITPEVLGFPKPSPLAPNPIPAGTRRYTSNSSYYDNCGSTVFTYSDVRVPVSCPPPTTYIDTIFRTWIVTDSYFNADTCVDTILVLTGSFSSFVCPRNYDDIDLPSLKCDGSWNIPSNLDPVTGNPLPSVTGFPAGIFCRNINYTYFDTRLNVCDGTYKILREWIVVDWCTGRDTSCIQLIKVIDDKPPIFVCQPNQTVSTLPNTCTGEAWVDLPTLISDCSAVTWDVEVKRSVPGPSPVTHPSDIVATKDGIIWDPIRRQYLIKNLPVGWSWILFYGIDACGNRSVTPCPHDVFVEERTKPIAVCDLQTVVTLTAEGSAKVYAETFDDGSHDNCELDSFCVRRMDPGNCPLPVVSDTEWRKYVEFCCNDVGKVVIVVLKVVDKAGNTNECMVEVRVQDKQPPVVTCLPNITVSCEFPIDLNDLSKFGTYRRSEAERRDIRLNDPTGPPPQPRNWGKDGLVIEDCNLIVTSSVNDGRNQCGVGVITRTFSFRDDFNPPQSCVQTITVVDRTPFLGNTIRYPSDRQIVGCLSSTDPSSTGVPTWTGNTTCSDIKYTYTDQVFDIVENACYKVIRTWTVIDWCAFNPNTGAGRWTGVQVIKVVNNSAPTITSSCANLTFDGEGAGCGGNAVLIATADDDCTRPEDLQWRYSIDLNFATNRGIDINGTGNNASGFYPGGTHRITFFVSDQCGNESSCTFTFTIRDGKKPTPICRTGIITVIMPATGSVTIWARDLNAKSFDNCSPESSLRYSFSNLLRDSARTYNCPPNGISQIHDITIYVWDEALNFETCSTKVVIQDGVGNHCPDNVGGGNSVALIGGSIYNEAHNMVENVRVGLNGNMPTMPKYEHTRLDGHYAFTSLPTREKYVVTAEKNDEPLNGLSTFDIVLIQRHILGVTPLSSAYKVVAADVNNSQNVTVRDIAELRKLLLGVYNHFPNNSSWRFINAKQKFNDILRPWPLQEITTVDDLGGDILDNDFIAVKVGDVSGDAKTSGAKTITARNNEAKHLVVQNKEFKKGEQFAIAIRFSEIMLSTGMQMEFNFNPSVLRIYDISSSVLDLASYHINFSHIDDGSIRISYDHVTGVKLEGEVLVLHAEAVSNGTLENNIALRESSLQGEVYDYKGQVFPLRLKFYDSTKEDVTDGFYLFQNQPNPFSNITTISFYLAGDEFAELSIYDLNGQLVKKITGQFKAGFNSVEVHKSEIRVTGILYYQLETAKHRAVRKMLMIE